MLEIPAYAQKFFKCEYMNKVLSFTFKTKNSFPCKVGLLLLKYTSTFQIFYQRRISADKSALIKFRKIMVYKKFFCTVKFINALINFNKYVDLLPEIYHKKDLRFLKVVLLYL